MTLTFEAITSYMEAAELKEYTIISDTDSGSRLLSGFNIDSNDSAYPKINAGVFIDLTKYEKSKYQVLQIRMLKIIDKDMVRNSVYKDKFNEYLLKKNYENIFGRWCVDNDDGDVYIDWSAPLYSGDTVSKEQFVRVINGLTGCLVEAWAPMRRILETGFEKQLNADDIKKELLLILVTAGKFEIVQMVSVVSDVNKLSKALQAAKASDYDLAKEALKDS